jgi:serine/threonine-protein kinase
LSKLEPLRWERLIEAFTGAVERTKGQERERYLASVLGEDPSLLAEVHAMLRAHESQIPLEIERRLLSTDAADGDLTGRLIGTYRLVRLIAKGGMGEVYAGEREGAPFRQQVAVKVLRHGLTGPEASLRFRQERQILARLAHPGIVPLLDGGVTAEGRPYLVMQYVDGEPVTTFCEQRGCGIEERLRLAREIARAVEYAHRNLVVHRDLKPSNVLVTRDGEARLLDFGVAKLLEGPMQDEALPVTRAETRILTLEYAAPEQVQCGPITITTDVYGLGVLLYELLTGRRPFASGPEGQSSIEREILEGATEPASVTARQQKGERWSKRLHGDLDKIVAKAMARKPEQRYASAGELAADIERFLAGQPILARKPSLRYQIGKFIRRNRLASALAAVSLLLLLSLTGAIWYQAGRVARERDVARSEQQRADGVLALLVDLLSSANPEYLPGGSDITLGEFLGKAESIIAQQRSADPAVQARLRHTIGKVFLARSQYAQARTHLEAALAQLREADGAHDMAAAAVLHDLAKLTAESRSKAQAVPLLQQSLQLHRRLYGDSHPSVAQCMQDLGNALADREAQRAMLEGALSIRRKLFEGPHIDVAESLNALGALHFHEGNTSAAKKEFEEALEILRQVAPPGHPSTLSAMNNLSVVLLQLGRYRESESLERSLLDEKRRVIGSESVPVAITWGNLGTALAHFGKHDEAERAFGNAHTLFVKLLGREHIHVANAARNLARIRLLRGDNARAAQWFREAIEVHRKVDGTGANYWFLRAQAAVAMGRTGRTADAVSELRLALEKMLELKVLPLRTAEARTALGFALLQSGEPTEAEAFFRESLELRRNSLIEGHPAIAEAECALGAALAAQGKPEGRLMVERSLPRFRAWGLADPVYLALVR